MRLARCGQAKLLKHPYLNSVVYVQGAVPGPAVNRACKRIVDKGSQAPIPARISGYGGSFKTNLKVVAVGGCGAAGKNAPAGVQAV